MGLGTSPNSIISCVCLSRGGCGAATARNLRNQTSWANREPEHAGFKNSPLRLTVSGLVGHCSQISLSSRAGGKPKPPLRDACTDNRASSQDRPSEHHSCIRRQAGLVNGQPPPRPKRAPVAPNNPASSAETLASDGWACVWAP
jgi:hypothetical protein